jgi:hypothetical protein
MKTNTILKVEDYDIADTSTYEFQGGDLFSFIKDTLTEASSATKINAITSTYGKYANEKANLIEALLEEHKSERDRENKGQETK